ncbi:MAG: hypothetical protein U0610_27320 [bacterium]
MTTTAPIPPAAPASQGDTPAGSASRRPTHATPGADSEVGGRWRRWLRRGSIALILATLIPSGQAQIMWLHMHNLTMFATGILPPRLSPPFRQNMLFLFSAFSWTIVFTGWLGFRVSRTAERLAPPLDGRIVRFARGLWLATLVLPCAFAIPYSWQYEGFGLRNLAIAIPVYGLIGAWIHVRATRQHGTPFMIFWLMVLPLAATLVGWTCIAIDFFVPSDGFFTHGIVIGLGGTLAMWIGLIGWWRALREHARSAALDP